MTRLWHINQHLKHYKVSTDQHCIDTTCLRVTSLTQTRTDVLVLLNQVECRRPGWPLTCNQSNEKRSTAIALCLHLSDFNYSSNDYLPPFTDCILTSCFSPPFSQSHSICNYTWYISKQHGLDSGFEMAEGQFTDKLNKHLLKATVHCKTAMHII